MPIQEALVWAVGGLARPANVLFDPPCVAQQQDVAAWTAVMPQLQGEIQNGRYVMALIQCRGTRDWNQQARQYSFVPNEDYLVAALSVLAALGNPYVPGTVSGAWLRQTAQNQALPANIVQLFQCSPEGVNLTMNGVIKLIQFHQTQGAPHVQAINLAVSAITDGQRYGWRGGIFPAWVQGMIPVAQPPPQQQHVWIPAHPQAPQPPPPAQQQHGWVPAHPQGH